MKNIQHFVTPAALLLVSLFSAASRSAAEALLVLHYDQPAAHWEKEALPIGNGSMGAMLFGGLNEDQIQFNEESLSLGDEEVMAARFRLKATRSPSKTSQRSP